MIKNEFLPYEEAIALKELGFNAPCAAFYGEYKDFYLSGLNSQMDEEGRCTAPLWQQAFKFFRDNYNLHSEPIWDNNHGTYWFFSITEIGNVDFTEGRHNYDAPLKEDQDVKDGYPVVLKWVDTYEKAQLNCIRALIKIASMK